MKRIWKYDCISRSACLMLAYKWYMMYNIIVFENLRFRLSLRRQEGKGFKNLQFRERF